jgi:hypothetical protein
VFRKQPFETFAFGAISLQSEDYRKVLDVPHSRPKWASATILSSKAEELKLSE